MSRVWEDPRVVEGAAAQNASCQRLDAGERAIGWKVAFSAPAAMAKLGIDGPLGGFLTDATLLASGDECSLAGWTQPAIEAEIAIHVGADLPPARTATRPRSRSADSASRSSSPTSTDRSRTFAT